MNKEKAKVFFIMHMPPPIHGAAMVGKFIHDSYLVNEEFTCQYMNMMLANSLENIGKIGFNKLRLFIDQLLKIKNIIKSYKPNLVYLTPNSAGGAFYKDFLILKFVQFCLCLFVRKSSPKIVVHFHNKGVVRRQNLFIDNVLYRLFFKKVKVILLANVLYKDVEKYVTRDNVYICANGILECNPVSLNVKRSDGVVRLLFLSNLLISKGVIVLLDALEKLKESDYSFFCSFVGGETDEMNATSFLSEVERRNLSNYVSYEGSKYGEYKIEYFKTSDIFVFPSLNDAFPLVLIEAMQHKLPIISTNEGGIPDMVIDGENGLICEKNAESLANSLIKLLENAELRHQLGENGYLKYKNEFTIDSFEKKFVEILHEITNS